MATEGWGLPGGGGICRAWLWAPCAQDEGDEFGEEETGPRWAQPSFPPCKEWLRVGAGLHSLHRGLLGAHPIPEQQAVATVGGL